MPSVDLSTCLSLPHLLRTRAERTPDRDALKFVTDDGEVSAWTYGDLWRRASWVAQQLIALGVESGDVESGDGTRRDVKEATSAPRAVLLFPPGLEFMAGFLGAQIAGFIPVPTAYPKPNRAMPRLDSAAKDCRPSVLISDTETLAGLADNRLGEAVRELPRIATDNSAMAHALNERGRNDPAIDEQLARLSGDSIAFLQYTSGSTSEPKGVLVRHRNLMSNLESIRQGFHIAWYADDVTTTSMGVFWLPYFHDMGLIGGIFSPLYAGGTSVLISPRAFLQRPIRWLEMISDEKAWISGAPNFAYQLCIDRVSPEQTDRLDLSCWRTAFCGAEPIAARTLSDFGNRFEPCGFSTSAYYPCYGLAEATLLVAGGDGPAKPNVISVRRESLRDGRAEVVPGGRGREFTKFVSCGTAALNTELRIVDPQTHQVVHERTVGEIWIRGAGVSDGYWNREAENESQFRAKIAGGDDSHAYCRTGDLGFLFAGELFITGRLKDVIVLRGRNHYPQDIETTVCQTLSAGSGQVAAFAVDAHRGEALVVVAELPRNRDDVDYDTVVRRIRRGVIEAHEIDPSEILLVRPATVPLTSSGKVQRSRCRDQFLADEINTRHRYRRAFAGEQALSLPDLPDSPLGVDRLTITEAIESWLSEWLTVRAGVRPDDVELEKPFADYGLDSMTAVELSGEIQDWSGIEVTPIVAINYPSVAKLANYITTQWMGVADADKSCSEDFNPETLEAIKAAEMEGLLDKIEGLSDDQINHALAEKRRS